MPDTMSRSDEVRVLKTRRRELSVHEVQTGGGSTVHLSSIVEPGAIFTSREETQGMAGAKRAHGSALLIGRYKVHFDRFFLYPITEFLASQGRAHVFP